MDTVQRIADAANRFAAEFIGVDPVWQPMYLVVPEEWRDGFMFMGSADSKVLASVAPYEFRRRMLHQYKHGITRRYLIVDDEGNCYRYHSKGLDGEGHYSRYLTAQAALDHVFEDIEKFGATRATAYSQEYIEARNKALAEAGYQVVCASPSDTTITAP